LYGWKSAADTPIRDAFKRQKDHVMKEFDDRSSQVKPGQGNARYGLQLERLGGGGGGALQSHNINHIQHVFHCLPDTEQAASLTTQHQRHVVPSCRLHGCSTQQ
jgi:hypothetical protein